MLAAALTIAGSDPSGGAGLQADEIRIEDVVGDFSIKGGNVWARQLCMDQDGIKALIMGRRAVLTVSGDGGDLHAIAWTGSEAIDCSDGGRMSLDNLTIFAAQILSPVRTARESDRTLPENREPTTQPSAMSVQ